MQRTVGERDIIARIGGEEFCAILPGRTLDGAHSVAERIRLDLIDYPPRLGGETFPATVSAGLAISLEGEAFTTVLRRADIALYAAKRGGRNRVSDEAARRVA